MTPNLSKKNQQQQKNGTCHQWHKLTFIWIPVHVTIMMAFYYLPIVPILWAVYCQATDWLYSQTVKVTSFSTLLSIALSWYYINLANLANKCWIVLQSKNYGGSVIATETAIVQIVWFFFSSLLNLEQSSYVYFVPIKLNSILFLFSLLSASLSWHTPQIWSSKSLDFWDIMYPHLLDCPLFSFLLQQLAYPTSVFYPSLRKASRHIPEKSSLFWCSAMQRSKS